MAKDKIIEEGTEVPEEMKQKLAEIVAGIVADALLKQRADFKRVVELILPFAKGYVAEHQVGSNQECIEKAVDILKDLED